MTDTLKRMYTGQPGTTDTLLYTAPAGGGNKAQIRAIHLANTTDLDATITIAWPAGASGVDAAEQFIPGITLGPRGTYDWEGNQTLEAGETIRGLQGTSGAITAHISGVEVT